MQEISLFCSASSQQTTAELYSSEFSLALCSNPPLHGYWLELNTERLELVTHAKHGAVYAEFVNGTARYRRNQGGGRGQLLARAIGLKGNNKTPDIVDATAGLGRDAAVLASLGCHVTLLERSPVAAALLHNAIQRATQSAETAAIIANMKLIHTEAIKWLNALTNEALPDVIYIDPMFPERSKTAAVKKEMQAFGEIIGHDLDSASLLSAALSKAKQRVVVKRPRRGLPIEGIQPSASVEGQTTRFDIYSIKAIRGEKICI